MPNTYTLPTLFNQPIYNPLTAIAFTFGTVMSLLACAKYGFMDDTTLSNSGYALAMNVTALGLSALTPRNKENLEAGRRTLAKLNH